MLYASWGSDGQSSFLSTTSDSPVKVYQDTLEVMEGKKATAFQVKVVTEGEASLNGIYGLHVYTNGDKAEEPQKLTSCSTSIYLEVPGLSQMTLNHVRHADLCSPTSTTAITRYLSNNSKIDPVSFAQNVWDSKFDIFGKRKAIHNK